MIIDVTLIDDTISRHEVDNEAIAEDLLNDVTYHLGIYPEKKYFGFLHSNETTNWTWLINDKKLRKQLKNLYKCVLKVKFYPPHPEYLLLESTRYQFCLQIQNDIKSGKLPCLFMTHAFLGACLVQSELGNYDANLHRIDIDYLKAFEFAPFESEELLEKVMEYHISLKVSTIRYWVTQLL